MKNLTPEQKEANKLARKQAREQSKELARIEAEKSQKPVKKLTISIEWKRSSTWGNCPRAEANLHFKDGTYERKEGYYASGCGYDKESTVIAEIFNDFLKYKLWELPEEKRHGGNGSGNKGTAPYGIHLYSENRPHFGGGIGTNCYYRIAEYIGGKFTHVASGKTFDVYEYNEE